MKYYEYGFYAESGEFFELREYGFDNGKKLRIAAPNATQALTKFINHINDEYITDEMTVRETPSDHDIIDYITIGYKLYYWRIHYEITNCHMCKNCNCPHCIYHNNLMIVIAPNEKEAIIEMKKRIENEYDYTPADIGEIKIMKGEEY